jgi:radical SAM superfamily enzyme YgiQ (UPF0313 family)
MHIAFIAMSGLRAWNSEITEAGLTMPGFLERSEVIASLPSLGLLTLAGMTPDGIDISYHEVEDIRAMGDLPDCDIAAISSYSAQQKDAYSLSDQYRTQGVRTVLGGLHVTALPEEAAEHADSVVVGEGEIGWADLVSDLGSGRSLRNVYAADGREFDLADSPMPRFDLLNPDRYNRLTVQSQRGCPWRCEFCASSICLTPKYKVKPVDRVLAEIHEIRKIWANPFIELADDNTFVDRRHSRVLLEAMASEGLRWFTETDIGIADDPELLELMRISGCAEVLIGLESPTAEGIDGVEQRRNWKRSRFDDYKDAIARIQGHGIAVNGCFVMGLDGDGPELFGNIERFVEESGQFDVQITVMTPYPGTSLYERLKREGRLLEEGAWERCTLFDVNHVPMGMTPETLHREGLALGLRLYTEDHRQARAKRFREQRRAYVRSQRTKESVA